MQGFLQQTTFIKIYFKKISQHSKGKTGKGLIYRAMTMLQDLTKEHGTQGPDDPDNDPDAVVDAREEDEDDDEDIEEIDEADEAPDILYSSDEESKPQSSRRLRGGYSLGARKGTWPISLNNLT